MRKNTKIIIFISAMIVFLIIILISILSVRNHKENRSNQNQINSSNTQKENTNTTNNVVVDQNNEYINGTKIAITYQNKSEVYNIDGTDRTITVNQNYAIVKSEDENVQRKLQEEFDKISNEEFEDYKKQVEESLSGEYPIDAEFMDYVGNLSLNWTFETSRVDNYVVSIKNQSSGSLGGVAWSEKRGFSFNAKTGELLTIADISKDGAILKNYINSNIKDYLKTNSQKLGLYSETMSNIDSIVDIDKLVWYLSDDGIAVCFEKYQVSPDTFEYTIPYKNLYNYMNVDFLK